MIEIKNISKTYHRTKALNDISFNLAKGDIVGLLGVNGAGKSTLMKILAGAIPPDSGEVVFDGEVLKIDYVGLKKRISYLSEDNPLYDDMYVREYLDYVIRIYGVDKQHVSSVIHRVGLHKDVRKKISALSKGNRQRLGLAQVFITNPSFLILDEATTGLDPNQREGLNTLLKDIASDKIIIYSTHILHEIKDICTRFIILDQGQIILDKQVDEIASVEEIFFKLTNENNS